MTNRRCYIGIDPGLSGGLAVISSSSEEGSVRCEKMPETEQGIWEWFRIFQVIMKNEVSCYAVIEQVSGWIGGNKKADGSAATHGGAPGSAMFKFGQNYGFVRGCLIAAGFIEGETFESVHPRTWQKAVGIEPKPRGERKESHKRKLKQFAQEMFDNDLESFQDVSTSITLATADALLLARYCMTRFKGANV